MSNTRFSPSNDSRGGRRMNIIGRSRESLITSQIPPGIESSNTSPKRVHAQRASTFVSQSPPGTRIESMRKSSSGTDVRRGGPPGLRGSPRGNKRRNTGIPLGPKRISKMPGASPLPIKISVETPNIQRSRSQRTTKEDLMLRQKKNEEFHCLFIIPRLVRAEIVGSCMDTVFDMKSRLLSEVRIAVEELISQKVIEEGELENILLPSTEYAFKSRGTNDYIMNESLPLYPFN